MNQKIRYNLWRKNKKKNKANIAHAAASFTNLMFMHHTRAVVWSRDSLIYTLCHADMMHHHSFEKMTRASKSQRTRKQQKHQKL